MGRKWDNLRCLLKKILRGVPAEISSEFKGLVPSENRYLSLGEKFAIYAFLFEKVDVHVSKRNRSKIGDFLAEIDGLTA